MNFDEALAGSTTLDEALSSALKVIAYRKGNQARVVYVAGPISSDGEHKIAANIERLMEFRRALAHGLGEGAFVFASPSIFTPSVYQRLRIFDMPREERELKLQGFYDKVIESKHLDGIYFTPGWDRSTGAKREHETAVRVGVPVLFL